MPYGCTCTRRSCVCCFQISLSTSQSFEIIWRFNLLPLSLMQSPHSFEVPSSLASTSHREETLHRVTWLAAYYSDIWSIPTFAQVLLWPSRLDPKWCSDLLRQGLPIWRLPSSCQIPVGCVWCRPLVCTKWLASDELKACGKSKCWNIVWYQYQHVPALEVLSCCLSVK